MSSFKIREEVLNVLLADLLSDRGLLSIPESIRHSVTKQSERRLPDVTVASAATAGRLHTLLGIPEETRASTAQEEED